MNRRLTIEPLDAERFAPYGDVIEARGDADMIINRGNCKRFHDKADLDMGMQNGRAGISIFQGSPYVLPLTLDMVERHPLGSQAFLPLSESPYLVIVAVDQSGVPGRPEVFRPSPGQGVNYHRNIWHGVLTPMETMSLFAVVDRIGDGENLEEFWFDEPYIIDVQ